MVLNPFPPPSKDFFEGLTVQGGADALGIEIGGWSYQLQGLSPELRDYLERRFECFTHTGEKEDSFRIRVLDGRTEHFIPPEREPRATPHPLTIGWEGSNLMVRSYGFVGWMALEESHGEVALGWGAYERNEWSVENYLRICTAWKAVREGGVLLHGASILYSNRAHVFIGASGSGKSTLAERSRKGLVISDDLTLVRRLKAGFRVAGTPFRGTYRGGDPVQGLFPLGGIYQIKKGEVNRIEPCPTSSAVANLLASSPFVLDQIKHEPRILVNLRALQGAFPVVYLYFNLGGDFWEVIPTSSPSSDPRDPEGA